MKLATKILSMVEAKIKDSEIVVDGRKFKTK